MKTKLLSLAFAGMLALAMIGGAVVYGAVTAETADASAEAEVHTAAPEAASADEADKITIQREVFDKVLNF